MTAPTTPKAELTDQDKRFVTHKNGCYDCKRANLLLCLEGERLHNIAVEARMQEIRAGR